MSGEAALEISVGAYLLLCCALAWVLAQGMKSIRMMLNPNEHFDPALGLFYQGGMPSSHSAFVGSLSLALYIAEGVSTAFAVSMVFGLITIRDALGVRRHVGEHAKILNAIAAARAAETKGDSVEEDAALIEALEERVGHRFADVVVGLLLAVLAVAVVTFTTGFRSV